MPGQAGLDDRVLVLGDQVGVEVLGAGAEPLREPDGAGEAAQIDLGAEPAGAEGGGELLRQIDVQLAEEGQFLALAHLIRGPVDVRRLHRGGSARRGEAVQSKHMPLPVEGVPVVLVEAAEQPAEALVLGGGDAQFVVVPVVGFVLGQQGARVHAVPEVGDVAGVEALHEAAGNKVVRIDGVVCLVAGLPVQAGAGVGERQAGDLALHH